MSTLRKNNTHPSPVPYCFSSNKEALDAEKAINEKFDFRGYSAYATARILYVPYLSAMINLCAEDYVLSIGGRRHNE